MRGKRGKKPSGAQLVSMAKPLKAFPIHQPGKVSTMISVVLWQSNILSNDNHFFVTAEGFGSA